MLNTRKLNLIDIFSLKKDLLWGKDYYGLFENGKLIDCLLYSKLYKNRRLYQVHESGNRTREFLNQFTNHFSRKRKVRYFFAEFDEVEQVQDIEFMHNCGFKRFDRNYCFEYDSKHHDLHDNTKPTIHCRVLEREDIDKLVEIDSSKQILEYRDELFRSRLFFKEEIENIIVFADPADTSHILGFAHKREIKHEASFDFILQSKDPGLIQDCITAFAEYHIHFEKYSESFRFILSETNKDLFKDLAQDYNQVWTSQCLILEGAPRIKNKNPKSSLAFRRAATS
ncbi:MAG: hypothetical protein O3C63_01990 [Cyanobacteria bacterium]|nr:hypothetical protein [Cyanobacteriota bacterium]MDA1020148.1 hypothetical protein [Cyanobacteriota bacterium]